MALTDTELVDVALSVMTLVTGEAWDRAKLEKDSGNLKELAVRAMINKGISRSDAIIFVDQRWSVYAADNPPVPTNDDPMPKMSIGTVTPEAPTPDDLRQRATGYRERKFQKNPSAI